MLVVASMIIWGTEVTPLQFFGYSIALGGMVYYRLGYETLKTMAGDAGRRWAEFGAQKPALRKLSIVVFAVFVIFTLLGGLAPTYAPDYDPANFVNEMTSKLGKGKSF
jgi:hypothetical protein